MKSKSILLAAMATSLLMVSLIWRSQGQQTGNAEMIQNAENLKEASAMVRNQAALEREKEQAASCTRGTFSSDRGPTEWACGCDIQGSNWVAQGQGCYHRLTATESENSAAKTLKDEIAELETQHGQCLEEKNRLSDGFSEFRKGRSFPVEASIEQLREIQQATQRDLDTCKTKLEIAKLLKQRSDLRERFNACLRERNEPDPIGNYAYQSLSDGQMLISLREQIEEINSQYNAKNCSDSSSSVAAQRGSVEDRSGNKKQTKGVR